MKRVTLILLFLTASLCAQEEKKNLSTTGISVPWGSSFDAVKENARGVLQYYKPSKYIITNDGEINYTYGFFYADPELIGDTTVAIEATEATEATTENQGAAENNNAALTLKAGESEFAYVIVRFPYLALSDIRKKMVDKFGAPTKESIVENRGVVVWESGDTLRTVWVDAYEKKPYCRKMILVNKDIGKKLDEYHYQVFNKKEIDTLKRLNP